MNQLFIPKNDVVFHSFFRVGNESITETFISTLIGREIHSLEFNSKHYSWLQVPKDKLGILEAKAFLDNGVSCNIELQLVNQNNARSRFESYWSRFFSSQFIKNRARLNKMIWIAILDYELDLNPYSDFHTEWTILNSEHGHALLTDCFELHIIELPKALKIKELYNPFVQWMFFLSNPNESKLLEQSLLNFKLKEALERLEQLSQDKELQQSIELRQKEILDENSSNSSNL